MPQNLLLKYVCWDICLHVVGRDSRQTESLADLPSSQNCVFVSTSTGERSRILEVEYSCGVKEVCLQKLLASCIASCVQAFYRFFLQNCTIAEVLSFFIT